MLRALLVALCIATCGVTSGAAKVEVVEAVLPGWPQGQPADRTGSVVVEFVLAPGGQVFVKGTEARDLPKAFEDESRLAMREWLIDDDDPSNCGFIHGRQEFKFVGGAAEPVLLGETKAWISGDPSPVYSFDRVEITGGRILRSQANDPKARARQSEQQDSYRDRRYARWKAARGDRVSSRYAPLGITPPVPTVRIEPLFPRAAIEHGQSGEFLARMLIDTRGRVARIKVVDSYPKGVYDRESRRALNRWEHTPAMDERGKPTVLEVCQLLSYFVIDEGFFHQGPR